MLEATTKKFSINPATVYLFSATEDLVFRVKPAPNGVQSSSPANVVSAFENFDSFYATYGELTDYFFSPNAKLNATSHIGIMQRKVQDAMWEIAIQRGYASPITPIIRLVKLQPPQAVAG